MSPPRAPDLASLETELSIIFDLSGRLLWRSPLWTSAAPYPHAEHTVAGHGWLEFIEPADVPRLLAWLLQADTAEPVEFYAMAPSTGRGVHCLWRKVRLDAERWLVFGAVIQSIDLPAAPCVFGDFAPPAKD